MIKCMKCECELMEFEEPFNICMICDSERDEPIMEFSLK